MEYIILLIKEIYLNMTKQKNCLSFVVVVLFLSLLCSNGVSGINCSPGEGVIFEGRHDLKYITSVIAGGIALSMLQQKIDVRS